MPAFKITIWLCSKYNCTRPKRRKKIILNNGGGGRFVEIGANCHAFRATFVLFVTLVLWNACTRDAYTQYSDDLKDIKG